MELIRAQLIAALVGFFTAGALTMLAGYLPIFDWELGVFAVSEIAALCGAIAGGVGATSGKSITGAVVGALLGGSIAAIFLSEGGSPNLTIGGPIVVASAAAVAGFLGGIIGQRANRRSQGEVRAP
jgi:hypothetical protein